MTTATPTLTFTTHAYERSHGRPPRGRGSWAFCPREDFDGPDYLTHTMWASPGQTLTQAKRQATAYYLTTAAGRARLTGKSGEIVVCT